VPPCFARPGHLAEAAAHSEFLAAARAGNLRLVRDDRGWTGWHVLAQTKPGTGSKKLEETMRYQSCRLSQDMEHVRGGDSDTWALVPVQSSKNSWVRSAANVKEADGCRSAESDVSSYA